MILGINGIIASKGESIVTSGLIMNLDAGISSSYNGSGTTWADISGNNNNGTLINGVAYSSTYGGGLVFDGVNDYVTTNDNSFRFGNKFTLNIWFYWNGVNNAGYNVLIGKRLDSTYSYNQYAIQIAPNRLLQFFARRDGGIGTDDVSLTYTLPSTPSVLNVCAVMDVNSQKLFVNNSLVSSLTKDIFGYTYNIPNRTMLIGATNDDTGTTFLAPFNSNIYKVTAYNRNLTDAEVTTNFNATKTRFGL